jgi:dsRNA-specific ribonuclease
MYLAHVGKEANKLEEVDAGLEQFPEVIYTKYHRLDRNEWTSVILPLLRNENLAAIARKCGISERQLRPHRKTQQRINEALRSNITV